VTPVTGRGSVAYGFSGIRHLIIFAWRVSSLMDGGSSAGEVDR